MAQLKRWRTLDTFTRGGMFFQGKKKRLRPISGLCVATAYLAKTSVIARNVGHDSWEVCSPEDPGYYEDLVSKVLRHIPLTSIINVRLRFPKLGSSVVFANICCNALWHLNVWTQLTRRVRFELIWYEDNWRYKAVNFRVFTICTIKICFSIMSRASINMTWVCIQGCGLSYCTQMSEKKDSSLLLSMKRNIWISSGSR